jgi:hypothetical protein
MGKRSASSEEEEDMRITDPTKRALNKELLELQWRHRREAEEMVAKIGGAFPPGHDFETSSDDPLDRIADATLAYSEKLRRLDEFEPEEEEPEPEDDEAA